MPKAKVEAALARRPVVCRRSKERRRSSGPFLSTTNAFSANDAWPRRLALVERRLPAPVTNQQPAEQHAAQMREVGHARLQAGESQHQLDGAVDDDQRTRLHR